MKQDVSISINAITEQSDTKLSITARCGLLRPKRCCVSRLATMWVLILGVHHRNISPELVYSIVLLFFACIVLSWAKRSQHRDILFAFGALFTSGCAILLTHITNAAFLAPDDGKKILLISFLIMLMSWNASRLVLGIGTLTYCFVLYIFNLDTT